MRKIAVLTVAAAVVLCLALPALAEEQAQPQPYGYMGPGMMGPGMMMGQGYGGYGMMGPGAMMGQGCGGYGMMGRGYGGWGLKPEEMKQWQEQMAKHQMESLPLRQKLMAKQLELQTLWMQPKVDQDRVKALSKEVAELNAELAKLRDKFLLDCRQRFGDRGWACPGWGGPGGFGGGE